MKYVISVKINSETEVFEFSTEDDRELFIHGITKMNPNVEYSTTEVEEGEPEDSTVEEEEEPWEAEASTHMSVQLMRKFDIPIYFTPYELLRYKITPSIPIYVYRVEGKVMYTQQPAPDGKITTEQMTEWVSTLRDPNVEGSQILNEEILRGSFDINRLRTRTKDIPKA